MRIEVLERLIDRLFGDGAEASPPDAAEMADLAAHLAQPGRPPAVPDGDPAEPLAAWLGGALDGAGRDAFEADLAHAPAERHDLEAAQSFLDLVTHQPLAAPADLVEAAVAALPRGRAPQQGGAVQAVARWLRRRSWTLGAAGGAVAVTFSVLLVVSAKIEPFAMQPAPRDAPAAAAADAVTRPANPIAPASPVVAPASPVVAPPGAPEPAKAVPEAASAAHALEQYRARQMDLEGAKQEAEPAMRGGASTESAQQDPCEPATTGGSKTKTAASAKQAASPDEHRDADCDRGYADKGIGSGPYAGTAPADAAAMPASPMPDPMPAPMQGPMQTPMGDDAVGSSPPAESGPH